MSGNDSFTGQLAGFVCDTASIPPAVTSAARTALQDTLGVALAGSTEEASLKALDYVRESGGAPRASVWGHRFRGAPADVALVNAISAHALDFDDTLATLRGHPSAPVIAAVMAVAETLGSDGGAVLNAYALGIDVSGKLGRLFGNGPYIKGWHNTATIGVFSATAAVARLRGDSPEALRAAWGIAAAQSAGVLRNFGTMSKSFQAGHAARAAVLAEALARRGFTADQDIFDGKDGFPATYCADGASPDSVGGMLGTVWELVTPGNNYKRWPCCYCSHRALGGLLDLIAAHGIRLGEIESIGIGFPPGADEPLVYDEPVTGLEGKFSIQYPVAAIILDGKLTVDSFTDEAVRRADVRAWMKKVRRYRIEDDKVYSGTVGYTDVEIVTQRGRFSSRIDKGPGSLAWPMSETEHDDKFLGCAGSVLDSVRAMKLLEAIKSIERQKNLSVLVDLMTAVRSG